MAWVYMACVDIAWLYMECVDMAWPAWTMDMACVDMVWVYMSWLNMAYVDMAWVDIAPHSGCVGNVHTTTNGDPRIAAAQNVLYSTCNKWLCTWIFLHKVINIILI